MPLISFLGPPIIKIEASNDAIVDFGKPVSECANNNKLIFTSKATTVEGKKTTTAVASSAAAALGKSMIAIRKDYSYKYNAGGSSNERSNKIQLLDDETDLHNNHLELSKSSPSLPSVASFIESQAIKKEELSPVPSKLLKQESSSSSSSSSKRKALKKPAISILQRYDYDKDKACPSQPKVSKLEETSFCAIVESPSPKTPSTPSTASPATAAAAHHHQQHPVQSFVPLENNKVNAKEYNNKVPEQQKAPAEKKAIKLEPAKSSSSESSSKDSQNINKINNKINIIFQLNDNTKSLRKNIILHRRGTPSKKVVQKITIKEANNNNNSSTTTTTTIQEDVASKVPEKVLCTSETQTEESRKGGGEGEVPTTRPQMNMTISNPLVDEPTEHLFFENDILISLQQSTISFFEFDRLGSMLKKCETEFRLIDKIPRRMHDAHVDASNKYQRLCYSDQHSLPIYVEMRAKQKELDDPNMCPIAFLYCNVYYVDQRRAKFSSVHLDTVKSITSDIRYTAVPWTSYFIMAWNEKATDQKGIVAGIVKYKLTPNLDLAKLASIRQFPKLNYRIQQMSCAKGL